MEEHIDVADAIELFNRLQLFLAAQGWTVNSFLTASAWQTGTGFIAGDEVYLDVTSNGYGNQSLHYRFRVYDNQTSRRRLTMNQGYGDVTLDTSNFLHPVSRFRNPTTSNFVNRPFQTSAFSDQCISFISDGVMPRVWFLAFEQKYCCVAIQLDSQKIHFLQFGSQEMEDLNSNWGAFCYVNNDVDWKTTNVKTPFDHDGYDSFDEYITRDGRNGNSVNKNSFSMGDGSIFAPNNEAAVDNAFNAAPFAYLIANEYSELRPMARAHHYALDPGDNLWFYYARDFFYRINVKDYRIGERIKISTEEYIVFPNFQVDVSQIGVAFRIS